MARAEPRLGSQLVMALLPLGGVMANLVEMYADESYGGDDTAGPLCLAMYLYERDQALAATEEWVAVLNDPELPRPLPFFRMSDCAHGQGVFKGMEGHCDRIARKVIPIPRTRSIAGFAATVDQGDFARIMPPSTGFKNPYTFLAQMCLSFIAQWVRETEYAGKIIYNFEAGHKHRGDADRIMNEVRIGRFSRIRSVHYAGHAFLEKGSMPLLQSADLLAWHAFTDFKRKARGQGMRKDYVALARPQDKCQNWTADELERAVSYVCEYEQLTTVIDAGERRLRQEGFFKRGDGR